MCLLCCSMRRSSNFTCHKTIDLLNTFQNASGFMSQVNVATSTAATKVPNSLIRLCLFSARTKAVPDRLSSPDTSALIRCCFNAFQQLQRDRHRHTYSDWMDDWLTNEAEINRGYWRVPDGVSQNIGVTENLHIEWEWLPDKVLRVNGVNRTVQKQAERNNKEGRDKATVEM